MNNGGFSGRTKELKEKFFLEQDMKLLQTIRDEATAKERKKALADVSGIADDDLLDQLVQLDISGETVAALSLVPLITVAWADGSIDAKERVAVLAAAEQQGMEKEHPGYQLLHGWLQQKPDAKLLAVWKGYVSALSQTLGETAKNVLKTNILGRARAVAQTAGGLLGLGNKISKSEQAMLDQLEAAFD